ncbi:TIGR02530 family flagellar biosynthesis protein [Paenibacillus thalictri]|uniref:Flagellar biosynthesis protein n=1 Tax=Paenibacillus thalictri TaxID=2527873 RepID=A0A4Q9DQS5_9BACL|nr:TIGR02530 family flagellar biosynthesis protein [Paenibacillus thalictri]TBL77732.1 flagellar biosynthesis protein [Paenibacillus thalictri]
MTDRISIGHLYPNVGSITPVRRSDTAGTADPSAAGPSFQSVLQNSLVKFSHHAEQRLQQRGIQLKPEQLAKIQSAIDKADSKGAKDSLMLLNDMALIVNIQNRTVVTAIDGSSLKDNIFTKIDSAVIIS